MRFRVVGSFILLSSCAASVSHAGIVSTWIGPNTGLWNLAANWDNGVPGTGSVTDAVVTAAGTTVTLNMSPTVATVTLGSTCTLLVENSRDLTLGGLVNDGLLQLASSGSLTSVRINASPTLLSGSGTLRMGPNVNNRVYGLSALRTLVNGPDHTIAGGGNLGANSNLLLDNQGTVLGDEPSLPLRVDMSAGTNFNSGEFVASGGGTLLVTGSVFDNSGGVMRALDASVVQLESSTITGGEFTTQGSGQIQCLSAGPTVKDVHVTGAVRLNNAGDVAMQGTIVDDGVISLVSTGSSTDLRIDSSPMTFAGSGVVSMGANLNNRIYGASALRTIVNGPNHTIEGAGQFGVNANLLFDNQGVVRATHAAVPLRIDMSAGTNLNTGELQAFDGGTLIVQGTSIENAGGTIRAADMSVVQLSDATITGGDLVTDGSGVIAATTTPSRLVDLQLIGSFLLDNATDVELVGTIVNEGEISLESSGSATDLRINGDTVTLAGSGTLVMGPNQNNRIYGANALRQLVNGAGHTIRGSGQLGVNANLSLVNFGVIRADQSVPLTLDLVSTANQNLGELIATNGATLLLQGTTLDNAQGVIHVDDNSAFALSNSTIIGGDITTNGSGTVLPQPGTPVLMDVHLDGTARLLNGRELVLAGTFVNDGVVSIESEGAATDLRIDSDSCLVDGHGTIVMNGNVNDRIYGINATRRLVNGLDHTIRGGGQLGANSNLNITNKGHVLADNQLLQVDPTTDFTNEGTFVVTGSGSANLIGGAFLNLGTLAIDAGRTATRTGTLAQQDGVTRVDGTLTLNASSAIVVTGGLLAGDGVVNGEVEVSGGSASPSNADGSAIGSLAVNGPYTQTLDGGYVVDIGLAGNDHLQVNDIATLGGALQVRLVAPFVPSVGQVFTILDATHIVGFFQCIEFPQGASGYFHVVYGPTQVQLVVDVVPPKEADLNFDGVVGAADLGILLGAWGDVPCDNAICCPADLNGDGKVNAADLGLLLGEWG